MNGGTARELAAHSGSDPDDAALVAALRTTLDAEARTLDPTLERRLAIARRGVRRAPVRACRRGSVYRAPAAVATAAITLALLVPPFDTDPLPPSSPGAPSVPSSDTIAAADTSGVAARTTAGGSIIDSADALTLLSGDEDIDFYESVDFLLWLERQRG